MTLDRVAAAAVPATTARRNLIATRRGIIGILISLTVTVTLAGLVVTGHQRHVWRKVGAAQGRIGHVAVTVLHKHLSGG